MTTIRREQTNRFSARHKWILRFNRKARPWLISLLAVGILTGRGPTAFAGDPDLKFYTIKTENFYIHYQEGLEEMARQAATIYEEVHQELTIQFGWATDGPTEVLISDPTDSANAFAQSRYRPRIRMYATGPSIDRTTFQYDHWMRTLAIHEYTHIVSLRIHSGLARVFNAIFGNIYYPNGGTPTWFHEGISVLNETYYTSGGRIRSAEYHMIPRTAALEGKPLTLDHFSNRTRAFPRGVTPYLYGGMFYNYLRQHYGLEKLTEMYHYIGGRPFPWGLNRMFKEVFGEDLITIYDRFLDEITEETARLKRRLEAEGLTNSRPITFDGEFKGQPIFSADGHSIIMSIQNQLDRSGIFRVPLDGSRPERMVLSSSWSPVSMDRSGRLFYTRQAPFKHHYSFRDVFVKEPDAIHPRRLTHGRRARSASISPRGDQLVMAVNNAGTTKLVLADDSGRVIKNLVDSAPDDQVYLPCWSPRGDTIAVIVRHGPQVDLALVDAETGQKTLVTDDRAVVKGTAFDPTGRYVLFASDRTGISNIYAFDLEQRQLRQLTNVLTGAYYPAVSPDGSKLAFLKYSTKGYDLHIMPFEPQAAKVVTGRATPNQLEGGAGYAIAEQKPLPRPSEAPSQPYNPLPSFLPQYWKINTEATSIDDQRLKIETAFIDMTRRHRAGISADFKFRDDVWASRAAYSYDGLGPRLSVGASFESRPRETGYSVSGDSKDWIQHVVAGTARLSLPIRRPDRNQNFSVGYSIVNARPRGEFTPQFDPSLEHPRIPAEYSRAGLNFGWSLSDTYSSVFGISPERGKKLSAAVDVYHPMFGGNQVLTSIRYGWTQYWPMPWLNHHVIASRLSGGFRISDPPEISRFSVGGYDEQDIVERLMDQNPAGLASLRGYPQSAFKGDQYHSLRAEYRFPIHFFEAGYATFPMFVRSLHAGVFTDNVLISFDKLELKDWRSSIGAELVWQLTAGYFMPLTFRIIFAHGLMEQGLSEFTFIFGNTF